jgi:hypothetical protein
MLKRWNDRPPSPQSQTPAGAKQLSRHLKIDETEFEIGSIGIVNATGTNRA